MRSDVSMLTKKGNNGGQNLDRNQSRFQNQVCIPKKGCLVFGGRKRRNILGAATWKSHNKDHEVPCNNSINWRMKSSTKVVKYIFRVSMSNHMWPNIFKILVGSCYVTHRICQTLRRLITTYFAHWAIALMTESLKTRSS